MAHFSVERAHGLGKEAAREKADKLAQKLSEQYGLVPQWSGDTPVSYTHLTLPTIYSV